MFSFLEPAYIKEARLVLKSAQKLLHYKRDILPASDLEAFKSIIARLEQAIRDRDRAAVETTAQDLDTRWAKYLPPASEAAWRENCEVFLVAIVIAIGVRTFFLQPFTIPTGSMQPTLNGIIGHPTDSAPPNFFVQAFDFVMRGRNYVNTVAKSDDIITGMSERKMLFFFTLTDVQCDHSRYTIWAPIDTLRGSFEVIPGRQYHTGDAIARGYIDAGDHVFVDKVAYNIQSPQRGQVIVFSTRSIPRIERELKEKGEEGSEFYIKRLAGVPGDTLRVDSPNLYVNGSLASGYGFQRVMSQVGDYRGYGLVGNASAMYLIRPSDTFSVPPHTYFAMGDNSYNSSDSRFWGTVPQNNMMGRALFVYWPFLPHFGLIR